MGFDAPNKEIWLSEIRKGKAKPEDYFVSSNQRFATDVVRGAEGSSADIFHGMVMAGAYIDKQAAHALLGLDSLFPFSTVPMKEQNKQWLQSIDKQYADREKAYHASSLGKMSDDTSNNALFWLQTHPSQSYVDKVGSFIGENIVQLPLYEAIGAARLTLVTGLADSAGAKAASSIANKGMPKFANLTKTLVNSDIGKFAAKRLGEASDAFVGGSLEGKSNQDKLITMATWMGLGGALDISVGEIAKGVDVAAWLATHDRSDLKDVVRQGTVPVKKFISQVAAIGGRPLVDAIFGQASKEVEEAASKAKVETPTLDKILTEVKQKHEADPVKENLIMGAKAVLYSESLKAHNVPWSELEPMQKRTMQYVLGLKTQQAIDETVLHNPEIVKGKVENSMAEEFKTNPQLQEDALRFEKKYGIKASKAVIDAEKAQVERTTGVKNSQAAINKVADATIKRPATSSSKELAPKAFASFKVSSLAYFKNPLGEKAGKTTLEDYLKDLDHEDFIKELREEVGNFPYFERPSHLLLWAWKYRKEMPSEFQDKVEEGLYDAVKGSPVTWDRMAKNQEAHLEKLADSGRLLDERNVYNSSNFKSWRQRTKWQKDLDKEQEEAELMVVKKGLRRFPDAADSAEKVLRELQAIRSKATTANRDLSMTEKIRQTSKQLIKSRGK